MVEPLVPDSESGSGEIEIGYTISKAYCGQRVATEAGQAEGFHPDAHHSGTYLYSYWAVRG